MFNREEAIEKETLIRTFLSRKGLDGVLLTLQSNFAWATGGARNYVTPNTTEGAFSLFITPKESCFISDNIEMPRIADEEIGELFSGKVYSWWETARKQDLLRKIVQGKKIISDTAIAGTDPLLPEFLRLQEIMSGHEIVRYRALGRDAGEAMMKLCKGIKPGMTENEVAGQASYLLLKRDILPFLILVGADERIDRYRHPIPTDLAVQKRIMIVFCARRGGLIASLTRYVNFGTLDKALFKRHEAVCQVDTSFIHNTRPGVQFRDIFDSARHVYDAVGYPDEWKKHHQGGNTGYLARYTIAGPEVECAVEKHMAFAWNPSITGVKSEDTILCRGNGIEVLTQIKDWPTLPVEIGKTVYQRPDILVR